MKTQGILVSFSALALTCALTTTARAGLRYPANQTWDTTSIVVCWDTGSTFHAGSAQALYVQSTAEAEYHTKTRIRFSGWNDCNGEEENVIHIAFEDDAQSNGQPPVEILAGVDQVAEVELLSTAFAETPIFQLDVLHELGHALGLEHEQDRSDTVELCGHDINAGFSDNSFGPYDHLSIMDYCSFPAATPALSVGDAATLNNWYGWPGSYVVEPDGMGGVRTSRYHDEVVAGATVMQRCTVADDNQLAAFRGKKGNLTGGSAPTGPVVDTGACAWPPNLYRLPDNTTWFIGDFSGPACRIQDDVQAEAYGASSAAAGIFSVQPAALTTGRPAGTAVCHSGYPFRTRVYRLTSPWGHLYPSDAVQYRSWISAYGVYGMQGEPDSDFYIENYLSTGRVPSPVGAGVVLPADTPKSGTVPLYSIFNADTGDELFTIDPAEVIDALTYDGYVLGPGQVSIGDAVVANVYRAPEDAAAGASYHELPARGGTGGAPFTLSCNEGSVATGIYGYSGDYIDRLGLMCEPLFAFGTNSTPGAADFIPVTGGPGGSYFVKECPLGQSLVGLAGASGTYVDQLSVQCAALPSWRAGGVATTAYAGGGTGGSPWSDACPQGYVVNGIFGLSGDYVDRVQATCIHAFTSGATVLRPLAATSNDVLDGWPVANAVDGDPTTSYSSTYFPPGPYGSNPANSRGSYLIAWTPEAATGPTSVSSVFLRARSYANTPNGFPVSYHVYLTDPTNSMWRLVASSQLQPEAEHTLVLDAPGGPWQTYAMWIVPDTIGADINGNHYFQLAEVGFLP